MKRFIAKSIIIVLLPIVITTPVMILKSDDWSKYSHEINVSLAYKRLYALRNTNKIVIVAGSNGGFSMNSHLISTSLHMPVVNTSTHAGIGVRMQFEIYKDLLNKGDIVVFCPEYYSDKKRLYGESTIYRILSTHMPKAYFKMSITQWINTIKYAGIHYNEARKHENSLPFDGPYSSKSVNQFGDISYHRDHQEIKDVYHFKGEMDNETLSYYQYIHQFCEEHGIQLIYLPPTIIHSTFVNNTKQIDSLEHFMATNKIPFQAKPSRYCFPDSLYFDTPYHMTTKGADKRTLKVVEDLKRILKR